MDGVANMRARMGKLGGRFEVHTQSGQGTVVRLDLPLN
jgi:signal transduction histidine kinase